MFGRGGVRRALRWSQRHDELKANDAYSVDDERKPRIGDCSGAEKHYGENREEREGKLKSSVGNFLTQPLDKRERKKVSARKCSDERGSQELGNDY